MTFRRRGGRAVLWASARSWTLGFTLFAFGCSGSVNGEAEPSADDDAEESPDPDGPLSGDDEPNRPSDPSEPGSELTPDSPTPGEPGVNNPDGPTPNEPGPDQPGPNPDGPEGPGPDGPSPDGPGPDVSEPVMEIEEFTRLTREEYRSTIQNALGVDPDVTLIPVDGRVGPFTSNGENTPDPVHPYLLAAEDLAASLIPDRLPVCEAQSAEECIADDYREPFEELLRRPVTETELSQWTAMVVDLQEAGVNAEEATRSLLASVLMSPDFLFRASPSNFGDATARRLAERLSYVLWDAPPDRELSEAMAQAAGDLDATLASQAGRLSRDARATSVLARFVGQWLHVDTDLRLENPEFAESPAFLEFLAFVEDALQNDTPIIDFIASEQGFVHRDNLDAYQLDELDEDGGEVAKITWSDDSNRRGLLAQDLLVASTRHPDLTRRPIFRGVLVRRSLLCDTIPAPSPDLVELAGEVGERTEDPRCAGCHQMIDPVGHAFAVLDPDTEGTATSAEVLAHAELQGTYESLPALLEAVASSRAFAECFSRHWLAFFLEQPMDRIESQWVSQLADSVEAGASLGAVVEQTMHELSARSETAVPWCVGE